MERWPAATVPSLAVPGRTPDARVFDTPSGALAVAAPGPEARIYACGITPYDATHIGHAATYIAWDLLVRAWRDSGRRVRYVQNVTDIDDPLLERATRDGRDWRDLADAEIDRFRSDMAALRVLPPDHLIGAVEALPVIEEFSAVLADRGATYDLEGDVYFCRSADHEFGSVSRLGAAQMLALSAERGGDPGRPGKKDPLDALVWLARRPGEPFWDSRFGQGRPGWHVECAAIATRYLGRLFDVQAGGTDLIFPHHELSASHARVALADGGGAAFARRYVHAGMVRLDGEKMSKSLGNLVFVSGLRDAGVDPMAIRLAILAHHYRGDWDWTGEGLAAAERRLAAWRAAAAASPRGEMAGGPVPGGPAPGGPAPGGPAPRGPAPGGSASETAGPASETAVLAAIRERLADDLDAPGALAVLDAWARGVLAAGPPPGSAGLVVAAIDALLGIAL